MRSTETTRIDLDPSGTGLIWRAVTSRRTPKKDAFTLTELLVVIGSVALLAAMVLPALAGVREKGGRGQCANNLRQVFVGSMLYANEFNTRLPPWRAGHPAMDNMTEGQYSRWVFGRAPAGYHVPQSFENLPMDSFATGFHNAGYLYGMKFTDGSILYCPGQWGSVYGAKAFLPLLTMDSSGAVRSSYFYNPRAKNPLATPYSADAVRRYQTTTQFEPHKLFATDLFTGPSQSSMAHFRDRGWNVLFTDGSVSFSRNEQAYNLIASTDFNDRDIRRHERVFDFLELDR